MGEAKNRGTALERIAAAKSKSPYATAPRIKCNGCKAELHSAEQIDVTGLRGIELAFKAHCATCDQETWAVRGEPPSVRAFYEALEKAAGEKIQLGSTGNALPS